ncbi:CotS family spore coat protein [Bacillus sp. FJAT-49736]|uniref:CotS family spore coat protein n=1 Tax=Bacillus sp. FJAT-49736 TaxID=2833582 RepID=UPI001BCA0479|nr:CotS family spore coat protein [Bacillus sp. FJAT-49736]MBS4174974.1 CotS family spore coat protein [Bacillus sp. FJAT-49736]
MEKNRIEPWVEEVGSDEFYVPDYIESLGKNVLKNYDFSIQSMNVVTTKPDKGGAIWKLATSSGPKSLKLLHRRPTRSMFSLGAQEYLVEVKKARVPKIIKTKDGRKYVEAGGKLWFVAEWIEPLEPVSKDLNGAKMLCAALGEFHRLTKGYVPPHKAEIASRLYKWPSNYEKVRVKMDWFRNIASAYHEMPASSDLLSVVGEFERQAENGIKALQESNYFDMVKLGNKEWGLVHQDYGWSNGQKGPGGMWIIDLDGVAYDLPIRDLRKLVSGTMADLQKWDKTWIREMILAYHEENPISRDLYDILMIDLSLPNEFYKNIKEVVYEPEQFLNNETKILIKNIVDLEKTKWTVLNELRDDWKGME